jgi:hypothetical protein
MTSVQPVYPNGIFTWTDRVNNVSVDFANDVNSLASDLISVENTLGTNPENETELPSGLQSADYTNVSSRISDAMKNAQLPYGSVQNLSFTVNNTSGGTLNTFIQEWDPGNLWNGTDITIPCDGWYVVTAFQTWPWASSGYSYQALVVNSPAGLFFGNGVNQVASDSVLGDDIIDWTFSGNTSSDTGPIFGPNIPRWQVYGQRPLTTHIPWQGRLHKGDRLSVYSENGTVNANVTVASSYLRLHMFRNID